MIRTGVGHAAPPYGSSKKPFYVYFRILHAYTIIYLKYRVYCSAEVSRRRGAWSVRVNINSHVHSAQWSKAAAAADPESCRGRVVTAAVQQNVEQRGTCIVNSELTCPWANATVDNPSRLWPATRTMRG